MKIALYLNLIALILAPGFTFAQDAPSKNDAAIKAINMSEQVAASSLPIDQDFKVQSVPAENPLIALNAFYARSQFMAEPNVSSERKQTISSDPGIIESWSERIFNSLKTNFGPIQQDSRNSALDEEENDKSAVGKLVLKETLKYTQEQVPEIDRLIKAFKFEVSSEKNDQEDAEAVVKDETNNKEAGEKRIPKASIVKDKLFVKTGLRIPIESGKPTLVSETEARYHNLSSFIKVRIDGQYDNSLGLTYLLGKDIHLQAERQMNTTASLNLVQLVCKF